MPVDERTFVADVAAWVGAILDRRPDLPYGRAAVEEHGEGTAKRLDLLLYRRGVERVVLTGEVKMPDTPRGRSPFDGEVVRDAFEKAAQKGVPFYFTWNVRDLVLFQTHQEGVPWMDRRIEGPLRVVEIAASDDLRRPDAREAIIGFWEGFLERFAALEEGRRPLQDLPLDRRFILRLEAALEEPITLCQDDLARRYRADGAFRSQLNGWMSGEQGWELSEAPVALDRNLERAARLSCYILLTRLVFYEVLRRRFRVLASLASSLPGTPDELAAALDARFREAISYSRDYESVFQSASFGNAIPFLPDEAHRAWHGVIDSIEDFDFSRLDYEVIGRLYEQLIGPAERRRYGQFYTSPEVVDLINAFCIRSADARVLDPGCGSGTFLVRAYARKRALARRRGQPSAHRALLSELVGVDVNPFPAQLSTINLAIRHLSDEANYPWVGQGDFFQLHVGGWLRGLPVALQQQVVPLGDFDAVVGNPPYIRQEEMPAAAKTRLGNLLAAEWQGPGKPSLSGRSDVYVYFFAHGGAFLRPGGYLGFVTSVGWLDTDYGFRLQEFLLRNFRIVAVLESQVEKWFEDARVTTAVTILQREPDEARRRSNLVRFVQLRRPLAQIYSEALGAQPNEEDEAVRQADMDAMRDLIEEIAADQTTEYWRVRVRSQGALWEAGCRVRVEGEEEGAAGAGYKAGKWGQYLRGPDVWFDLLEQAAARLVPLQELAEVRFGFKTGADRFYCVRDVTEEELRRVPDGAAFRERWGISREETGQVRIIRDGDGGLHLVEGRFLEPEFHTLMEAKRIAVRAADVARRVINAPVSRAELRGTHLGRYVEHAERERWHTGATVASRARARPWYDLGLRSRAARAQMFWSKSQQYRHIVAWNGDSLPGNDNLYDLWAVAGVAPRLLWAVLNSTIVALAKHQFGRAAGIEGNLKTEVVDVNMMLVPDVRAATQEVAGRAVGAAERMAQRLSARTLPEEFSLADRQELDDAVLEMLGFADATERAQLRSRLYEALTESYAATREREIVAQRDRLRSKRRGAPTAGDMAVEIWDEHHQALGLLEFPRDFLRGPGVRRGHTVDLPSGPVEVGTAMVDTGRRLRAGTIRVGGPSGALLDVGSVARALFLEAAAACGRHGPIAAPDDGECESAVQQFGAYRHELMQRSRALAAQRSRDPRRQRDIAEALLRRALQWRRVGQDP